MPLLAIPGRGSLHHIPQLPGLASAAPDHLTCSTAEGAQQGRLALSLHVPCTSSGRKARMEPPWCPAQKLWATSLTTGGVRTPSHHTHVCTPSSDTQPLRRAHADTPTDTLPLMSTFIPRGLGTQAICVPSLPKRGQMFSMVAPLGEAVLQIIHLFSNFFLFSKYATVNMHVSHLFSDKVQVHNF